jgi:hypothetical protein
VPRSAQDARAWLDGRPSLGELRDAYPREWERVEREIAALTARGDVEELKGYVLAASAPAPARARRDRRAGREEELAELVRRQMTVAALKQVCLSAATGVSEGRVRFNLLNGWSRSACSSSATSSASRSPKGGSAWSGPCSGSGAS